jgi:hypothetical protein
VSGSPARRGPARFYAFDLLWLHGRDLRGLPGLERKARLFDLVLSQVSADAVRDSSRAGVIIEQPTETSLPTDATDTRSGSRAVNELISQPLMIPLAMIMGDKLGDGSPKMTLAKRNEAVEAFLLNRADKSFSVRVRIRCVIGRSHDADPGLMEPRAG